MIVIKSLVPGGVAQVDGRLLPGDRLIFVNDEMLENASLDEAVNALKGAPKGIVRIGVKKALPLGGIEGHQQAELQVFVCLEWCFQLCAFCNESLKRVIYFY